MKLGAHPRRTPLYGVLMELCAYYSIYWLYSTPHALWVQFLVFAIAVPVAIVGIVMTFRDYG